MPTFLLWPAGKPSPGNFTTSTAVETIGDLKRVLEKEHKVLYSSKLRFFRHEEGDKLDDGSLMPTAPTEIHVAGPGSVVQMLTLELQKQGSPGGGKTAVQKPAAAKPANFKPAAPKSGSNAGYPLPKAASNGQLGGARYPGQVYGGPNALHGQPPLYTPSMTIIDNSAMVEQNQLTQAMQESLRSREMDEEAQLRWAMQESLALSRAADAAAKKKEEEEAASAPKKNKGTVEVQSADDIKAFYENLIHKKESDSNQESTAMPWDSDEEGFAWDSDSHDNPSGDEADELPPLEPIDTAAE